VTISPGGDGGDGATGDAPAQRHSVWLKIANQPERLLASNAQFRGTSVAQLDHWIARVDDISPTEPLIVCNVRSASD
jgi:hypothetical protein